MIDREAVAARIAKAVATLSRPPYTAPGVGIWRYGYTPAFLATLAWVEDELRGLGFDVAYDALGTLIARNRRAGTPVIGIGSHVDAVRGGGAWDGLLGVLCAIEVARANRERGLELPLAVIAFAEEEGAGFGVTLLGSRFATGGISSQQLEHLPAIDDGVSASRAAKAAGFPRGDSSSLEDLTAWIEPHIEQGRVLQDRRAQIGMVTAIAGFRQGDLIAEGRADHAGATPMDLRRDAGVTIARCVVELEHLAHEAGGDIVGTAGELDARPGVINAIPGQARCSIDVRGTDDAKLDEVIKSLVTFAQREGERRDTPVTWRGRSAACATPLHSGLRARLRTAAEALHKPWIEMPSGAGHDTMLLATHTQVAMVFVPCRDGISHSPEERCDAADAATAVAIVLHALTNGYVLS